MHHTEQCAQVHWRCRGRLPHGRQLVHRPRLWRRRRLGRLPERRAVGRPLHRAPPRRRRSCALLAALFAKRAREMGGAGSVDGQTAQMIADAWFTREQNPDAAEGDEAAKFYRLICREARIQRQAAGVPLTGADNEPVFWTGPEFVDYEGGSMIYETTRFLYDACARARARSRALVRRDARPPRTGARKISSTSAHCRSNARRARAPTPPHCAGATPPSRGSALTRATSSSSAPSRCPTATRSAKSVSAAAAARASRLSTTSRRTWRGASSRSTRSARRALRPHAPTAP